MLLNGGGQDIYIYIYKYVLNPHRCQHILLQQTTKPFHLPPTSYDNANNSPSFVPT